MTPEPFLPLWSGVLCARGELPPPGGALARDIGDRRLAVFNIDGTLHCVDDYCTHSRSSLSGEGHCEGTTVECALHRARFDLTTGRPLAGPTRRPLRVYDLDLEGDWVRAVERRRP
jgi:nitrite reductase/ring-hydroxylating ferredoxin subunit